MFDRFTVPLSWRAIPWKGVLTVFGAFLGNLTLGSLYTFGNMSPYISSYMTVKKGQNVNASDMSWVLGVTSAGQGSLMLVGGIMERKFGPRKTALLGCALMSSGISLTYFTVQESMYAVVLTYGACFGCGISLAYISFLAAGTKWFPGQQGFVSGIIVSGFGLGPLLFNPIQTHYLNPRNFYPNKEGIFTQEEILKSVPSIFLVMGGTYATMQLIACTLASKPPKDIDESKTTTRIKKELKQSECSKLTQPQYKHKGEAVTSAISLTPLQFLQVRECYLLWFTFLFNGITSLYTTSMYKAYGQTFIRDDHFLSMVGATGAVFNCGGRIVWGLLIDKYSYKACIRCMCIGVLVLLLTLPATSLCGKYMYGLWLCCLNALLSGTFVLTPACVLKNFGSEHAGANFGIVFTSSMLSGPLSALCAQKLTNYLGYTLVFYILSAVTVCSFLLTIPFRETRTMMLPETSNE